MKKIILSAVAAVALFATQASAQSFYSYGSPSYYGGGYSGYGYGTSYAAPGPYVHIGSLDSYGSYGTGIVAASVRTPSYSYASPTYSYPTYSSGYSSYPSYSSSYAVPASYTSSYSYPSYSSSYSFPTTSYGSTYSYPYTSSYNYIRPATYRTGGVVATTPYYGGYSTTYNSGCRCYR